MVEDLPLWSFMQTIHEFPMKSLICVFAFGKQRFNPPILHLRTLDLCLPLPWGLAVFWSIFSRKQHENCWEPCDYTRVALLNSIRSLHWGLLLTWPLLWPCRPNKMRTCGRPTRRWDAGWARSIRRTLRCWGSLVQKITALRFLFTGWLELQAGHAHKRKRIVVKPSLV